jgi:xanthine/CO dehydrogenase XdhC/CoxF family maturation factor
MSAQKPSADDPLAIALEWRGSGRQVAVATVIRTWGSSPLPVGSQLVVDDSGNFAGSVSGGCIEGAVIEAAGKIIGTGKPQLLKFGVTDERAWEVGLACGGEIEIFVEKVE